MAITLVTPATQVATANNATTFAATSPTHAVGDMLIEVVITKPDTATPSTPTGWDLVGTVAGGTGTTGAGTGPVRITVFSKVATGTTDNAGTVSITSNNVSIGQGFAYRPAAGNVIDVAFVGAADTTTGSSAFTATMPSNPGITAGDVLLAIGAYPTAAVTNTAEIVSATGLTTVALTETAELNTTTANDIAGFTAHATVSSGTATAAPVVSSTSSSTTTTGVLGLVRLRELPAVATKTASDSGTFSATDSSSVFKTDPKSATDSGTISATETSSVVTVVDGPEPTLVAQYVTTNTTSTLVKSVTGITYQTGDTIIAITSGGASNVQDVAMSGSTDLSGISSGPLYTNDFGISNVPITNVSTVVATGSGSSGSITATFDTASTDFGLVVLVLRGAGAVQSVSEQPALATLSKTRTKAATKFIEYVVDNTGFTDPAGMTYLQPGGATLSKSRYYSSGSFSLPVMVYGSIPTGSNTYGISSGSINPNMVGIFEVFPEQVVSGGGGTPISGSESGTFSATEANTLAASSTSTETGTLSATETASILITSSTTDAGTLSATDASSAVILATKSASDSGTFSAAEGSSVTAPSWSVSGLTDKRIWVKAKDHTVGAATGMTNAAGTGNGTLTGGTVAVSANSTPANERSFRFINSGYFVFGDLLNSATAFDYWVVVKSDGTDTAGWALGQSNTDQDESHYPYSGTVYESSGVASGNRKSFIPSPSISAWRIYRVRVQSGFMTVWIDGVQQINSAVTFGIPSTLWIGAGRKGASPGTLDMRFTGNIAEVFITGTPLSGSDETNMYDYLNTEHALTSTPVSVADSGTISATDTSSSFITVSTSDSGTLSATDTSVPVLSATRTDTGTFSATDTSAPVISMTRTDTGTLSATDATSSVTVVLTTADSGTFSATEARTLAGSSTSTDTGTISATDTSSVFITISTTDTGTLSAVDSSSLTGSADVPGSDSGTISATDTAVNLSVLVTANDTGTFSATDTSSVYVTVSTTDTGTLSATESRTLAGSSTSTDTGSISATDASAVVVALSSTDAGTISATDSSAPTILVTTTDTGTFSATDSSASALSLTRTDTGTVSAIDTSAVTLPFASSDSGSIFGTDASSVVIGGVVPLSTTDSGTVSATDASVVVVQVITTDTGTLSATEGRSISGGVTATDTGTLSATDTSTSFRTIAVTDSGTVSGTEMAVVFNDRPGIDTGILSGTETANVVITGTVTKSASDTGTFSGTESRVLAGSSTSTDTGTISATESDTFVRNITSTDTGTLSATESSAVGVAMTRSDTGTINAAEYSEALKLSSTVRTHIWAGGTMVDVTFHYWDGTTMHALVLHHWDGIQFS